MEWGRSRVGVGGHDLQKESEIEREREGREKKNGLSDRAGGKRMKWGEIRIERLLSLPG